MNLSVVSYQTGPTAKTEDHGTNASMSKTVRTGTGVGCKIDAKFEPLVQYPSEVSYFNLLLIQIKDGIEGGRGGQGTGDV